MNAGSSDARQKAKGRESVSLSDESGLARSCIVTGLVNEKQPLSQLNLKNKNKNIYVCIMYYVLFVYWPGSERESTCITLV